MARKSRKREVRSYAHENEERANNPPVGLVTPDTDRDAGPKTWKHDPHLDPELVWAGKAERASFEVPTVSLHVHERIDPRAIIEVVRKRNGGTPPSQPSLFHAPEENPPLRDAIEFYRHPHNWSNRLVAGDSLLVMNSLLEKEGMGGKAQCVYIDPPYGIRYGSNFQPFVNRRDVKDGKDEDLTQEPETIRAFRDTWELGVHSYLTYLRDRLLLTRELLAESGSCFVQIGDENVHRARAVMDEVFGVENFVSLITFRKNVLLFQTTLLGSNCDYILWYAKQKSTVKYRRFLIDKKLGEDSSFSKIQLIDGTRRSMTASERRNPSTLPDGSEPFILQNLLSSGYTRSCYYDFWFDGRKISRGRYSWKTTEKGMERLVKAGRVWGSASRPGYVQKMSDYPVSSIDHLWHDTGPAPNQSYVVETNNKVIQRCILMTTDPGDLVLDPTCGSGTTAYVAEQWGRRWITCDTSRVAIALAKQRLMTANFDYYELAHPDEGVGSGFKYRTVPHVTLKSIANNEEIDAIWEKFQKTLEPLRKKLNEAVGASWEEWEIPRDALETWPEEGREAHAAWRRERVARQAAIDASIAARADQEYLYDQPYGDRAKARVTGPFTVEAVPAPVVKPLDEALEAEERPADDSVARTGETRRQADWRDELLGTGIRGRAGQRVSFARLEPLPAVHWLHADGETRPDDGEPARVVVSFGPEHAPMEQRQVELAIGEARKLVPRPGIIVFAAFQFDPEAAKDIDETDWPGLTLLRAQMNADLLTGDLKKKRASNESFWLIGQPDARIERIGEGEDEGKFRVVVQGFDYYNARTGEVESGGTEKIAIWMLDPDYDGRSLFPRQVFFPMADPGGGWTKLARNLKAELDAERMEAWRGASSLPFEAGENRRAAVKIVDDRGIESLKVMELE